MQEVLRRRHQRIRLNRGRFMSKSGEGIDGVGANDAFLETVERTAGIVDRTIQDRKYEAVGKNLERISGEYENNTEKFVFERPSITGWVFVILVSVLLSAVYLYFTCIAAGTLAYSSTYRLYGVFGLWTSLLIILFNILLMVVAIREIQYYKRYDHYQNVLRFRSIEIVDDLAEMIKSDRDMVEEDLRRAVRRNLIPQGHFGRCNLVFMVSDAVYDRYSKKKAAYDRYFRKVIEERQRVGNRSEEIREVLEQGKEYVSKIHDCNDIIKDKEVSHKLDRMERIVAAIFHEVEINPSQAAKLGVFINYYLPTTEKLLESYIELDERQVKSKSVTKTQKDIENALDSINNAYEGLLERFYQEQERYISGEIFALESIMKQEGLSNGGV